ncbi:hypothetical protein [Fluviicola taffensis]|uniref:Uncharacterized protein n=1 Tax=Fluviicola taffensis (strain DSM 16823 / NCIMB 13979 / RW262) TaxID=755732 RepID=F2IJD1_FLUTR|nr:hypothetical protein [Fluviicola taffensis]AEA46028.1 hypothetical protein Fluta_4066 [Fluviicola taffensis DSM 16823]
MKNLSNYLAPVLALCFSFSLMGNNLHARPEHPKSGPHKHGQKKHKYYYYPRQNVYYDPSDNVYFIWERTYWKPVSHLPRRQVSVTYSSSPKFTLWIASTHPYYYNPDHRKVYHEYRVVRPKPAPRVRVESKPKSNISFHIDINPVVVEPHRTVVVHEHHPKKHHHKGHDHGHGKGHRH